MVTNSEKAIIHHASRWKIVAPSINMPFKLLCCLFTHHKNGGIINHIIFIHTSLYSTTPTSVRTSNNLSLEVVALFLIAKHKRNSRTIVIISFYIAPFVCAFLYAFSLRVYDETRKFASPPDCVGNVFPLIKSEWEWDDFDGGGFLKNLKLTL